MALRLPKDLGLKEGTEVLLREEHGEYRFEPVDKPKRKFNIDKVWGSATHLKMIKPEDRIFEERDLWPGNGSK